MNRLNRSLLLVSVTLLFSLASSSGFASDFEDQVFSVEDVVQIESPEDMNFLIPYWENPYAGSVLLITGTGSFEGLGEYTFIQYAMQDGSVVPSLCEEGAIGAIGFGTATLFFPELGFLVLEVTSSDECADPVTGFRIVEEFDIVHGNGFFEGATGVFTSNVINLVDGEYQWPPQITLTGTIVLGGDDDDDPHRHQHRHGKRNHN